MSNYSSLKTTINANIRQNGNQEITGNILNTVLNAMVDTLGAGYRYLGIATPTDSPATPDNKVFYIASAAGEYTNFDNLVVNDGEVAILKWDTAWSKDLTGIATSKQMTQVLEDITMSDRILYTLVSARGLRPSGAQGQIISQYPNDYSYYAKVQSGDVINVSFEGASGYVRYAFTRVTPEVYVPVTGYGSIVASSGAVQLTAPYDGYVLLSFESSPSSITASKPNQGTIGERVYEINQEIASMQTAISGLQDDAVKVVAQALTAAQKTQARKNIGLGSISESDQATDSEDIEIQTNDGGYVGSVDNDGIHAKNLFLQSTKAGADKVNVREVIDPLIPSATEDEDEEIEIQDSNGQVIGRVNVDGIHSKEFYLNDDPISERLAIGMTAIFEDWGIIGDSLSSGYLAAPDVEGDTPAVPVGFGSKGRNIYRMSWGQILARMYGALATNFSVGGLTAKGWLDSYPGRTSENGYNSDGTFTVKFSEQLKPVYTICLGTNDSADPETNPVGDVSTDIDVNDYNNNADTFAGNYAKIIQMCKELTPSCKIFVITPFKWWSVAAENRGYNAVVRQMPNIFDKVFLIDLATDGIQSAPQYEYGAHGNTLGYVYAAKVISGFIDKIVKDNPETFKFQSIVGRAKHDNGQY